jgi:hypothetical protein
MTLIGRKVSTNHFSVSVAELKTTPREELLKAMVSLAEISLMRGA